MSVSVSHSLVAQNLSLRVRWGIGAKRSGAMKGEALEMTYIFRERQGASRQRSNTTTHEKHVSLWKIGG